jgi:sec-independent protein translocase protein TatA
MGMGAGSLVLVAIVALIIFGPKKLPEFGKAAGSTLKEFRNAAKGIAEEENNDNVKQKQDDL